MAMYDTSGGSNWDEILKRGGVTGTTQAPPLSYGPDPNSETANASLWPDVQTAAGADGTPQTPTIPVSATTGRNSQDAVNAAYQQYLGRGMGADEYQYWANVPDFAQQIAGSQEARSRTTPTTSGAPTTPTGPTAPQGMDPNQWAYQSQALRDAYWRYLYRLPTQEEIQSFAAKGAKEFTSHMQSIPISWEALRALQQNGGKTNSAALPSDGAATTTSTTTQQQGGSPGSLAWVQQQLAKFKSTDDPNAWVRYMAADPKVAAGDQSAIDYWLYRMSIGDGAEAVRTGQLKPFQDGGGGASANGNAFSDPATSQWESLVRQLTDRLNNPMPDSAKELQQTQALDPLERQRQTMKDQTAQRLSQRGITPTSGTWDEAMREVDRQFNELRTRTQAGFANSWAQNEDNRMLQAANLFKQIPQYQDARLTLAQNTLIPTNVGSLLQMQQQGNQWDAQQQQAFWTALAKSISDLLNR